MDKQELKAVKIYEVYFNGSRQSLGLYQKREDAQAIIQSIAPSATSGAEIIELTCWTRTPSLGDVLDEVLNTIAKTMISQGNYEYVSIEDIKQIINEIKDSYGK